MCVPFPCDDCWITSAGQLNLVVMDRENDRVSLIPNILVTGDSPSFALVLPTPSVPELSSVPTSDLWSSLSTMTARVGNRRIDDGLGCGESRDVVASAPDDLAEGVEVVLQVPVGAFEATVVSSDDAVALVEWLIDNGYAVDGLSISVLEPLVADGWVFTAMKLREGIEMPTGGWNTNVEPVRFDYEADEFEIPFGFLSVNRAATQRMVFYVVDDHRVTLPSFDTTYANRIAGSESSAIERQYPSLVPYISEGRFFTRLESTFFSGTGSLGRTTLRRAPTDDEFRATWRQFSSWGSGLPGWMLAFILVLQAVQWMAARRRAMS